MAETLRIDKWLWQARFFKSRTLAAKHCNGGKVRLNDAPINKAHIVIKPGDILTFPQGNDIRVIKIIALGTRRGPAPEAQGLYEDLDPPSVKPKMARPAKPALREKGTGRPTKKERRETDKLKGVDDEF